MPSSLFLNLRIRSIGIYKAVCHGSRTTILPQRRDTLHPYGTPLGTLVYVVYVPESRTYVRYEMGKITYRSFSLRRDTYIQIIPRYQIRLTLPAIAATA